MARIYELANDWNQVFEYIDSEEIDLETLENTLQCIEAEIEDKADNYARIIKNIEADSAAIKAEEERLAAKRKANENKAKWLKDNLYNAMKATGKEKIKTTCFSFGIQKNPPAVKFVDGEEIPKEFLVEQAPKVDTAAIKELLKSGKTLNCAVLVQGESLRIR